MRPILRPGLQVLRRDPRTLQLGLDWPGVGILPETPAVRAVLRAVDGFRDSEGVLRAAAEDGPSLAECAAALDLLVDSGAFVDQHAARNAATGEAEWAALWLLAGPGRAAADLAESRTECRISVRGTGQVADAVRSLLPRAQLVHADGSEPPTLVVMASDTEPDRAAADAVMHSGLPHAWVYIREVVGVVGPFVVPGKTPCLRCVDAARADLDPAWPTLLDSALARPLRAPACDPVLAVLVGAWATQEAALWAGGLRPMGWGSVIELPQGFGNAQTEQFDVHPHCGCGWPIWHDTMGA